MKKQLVFVTMCSVLLLSVVLFAQLSQGAEGKASPQPAQAGKVDTASAGSALSLEKKAKASSPVLDGLDVKKFRKRTPMYYSKLKLTEAQQKKLFEIQQEYHDVLAPLEARVARLRQERDAKFLEILDAGQKEQLKQQKASKASQAPKKAKSK